MRILVVGLGSIGRRHVGNLKSIDPANRVVLWRRNGGGRDLGDVAPMVERVVTSLDEALSSRIDAALVTNPASLHIETALAVAQQGIHVFVEKPISNTLNGVHTLMDLCRERSLVLMVGYNFRFYRPLQVVRQALVEERIGRIMGIRAEVGQFLPEWRPGRDYRESVSARHSLGGGVALELSHELDYVRWLVGEVKAVSAHVGRLSDLEIDVEDTAEIILKFSNGALGSIHLDMVQRSATRSCRVIGTEGTLTWDGLSHCVRLFSAATGTWSELHPAQISDPNEMYVEELRHFLSCVRGNGPACVSGEDGRRVLELALATKRSSESGQEVVV